MFHFSSHVLFFNNKTDICFGNSNTYSAVVIGLLVTWLNQHEAIGAYH